MYTFEIYYHDYERDERYLIASTHVEQVAIDYCRDHNETEGIDEGYYYYNLA